MKRFKKIVIFVASVVILTALFSSCAIDRKCPAYTQAKINTSVFNA